MIHPDRQLKTHNILTKFCNIRKKLQHFAVLRFSGHTLCFDSCENLQQEFVRGHVVRGASAFGASTFCSEKTRCESAAAKLFLRFTSRRRRGLRLLPPRVTSWRQRFDFLQDHTV